MDTLPKINHDRLQRGKRLALGCTALLLAAAPAHAQKVRLTDVSNVNFGTLANLEADHAQSQSVCAFSSSARYSVRATGSGTGGAFSISSGSRTLDYEVQWSSSPGQASGAALSSGVTRGGFTSGAKNHQCKGGPSAAATLIVILRGASVSRATAGSYSGTLTIILAPQ